MTRRLVTLALLVGLVAAACSQDSTEAYLERVGEITATMRRDSIVAMPNPSEPTRDGVMRVTEARRTAAAALAALEPPSDLTLEHTAVVFSLESLTEASDEFLSTTETLESDEFLEALRAATDLAALAARVSASCTTLENRAAALGHAIDLRC